MPSDSPLAVVEAWQAAASQQDTERLLALSDPEIEIVGPRGVARGHEVLREWLARAGLSLETRRAFVRGNVVVVEQQAVWRSVETGELLSEATIGSRFRVEVQRVTLYARYDSVDEALAAAGLGEGDEVVH